MITEKRYLGEMGKDWAIAENAPRNVRITVSLYGTSTWDTPKYSIRITNSPILGYAYRGAKNSGGEWVMVDNDGIQFRYNKTLKSVAMRLVKNEADMGHISKNGVFIKLPEGELK